jgi:hypothetical protein
MAESRRLTEKTLSGRNKSHKIFEYFYSKHNERRLITSVSLEDTHNMSSLGGSEVKLSFYRSSGTYTNNAGTWFPCYGIHEVKTRYERHESFPNERYGSLIKPNLYFSERYPVEFLNFIRKSFNYGTLKFTTNDGINPYDDFLGRFGSIECLLYSYAVGGGFWNSGGFLDFSGNDSRTLRDYLDKKYKSEIQKIKGNCPEIFALQNSISNPHLTYEVNHGDTDHQNMLELNKQLVLQSKQIKKINLGIHTISSEESNKNILIDEDGFPYIPLTITKSQKTESNYLDYYTPTEIALTVFTLGMYAYLKNCVDGREESLSEPTAIAKIALAILVPPVAMMTGIFSFFYLPNIVEQDNHRSESQRFIK